MARFICLATDQLCCNNRQGLNSCKGSLLTNFTNLGFKGFIYAFNFITCLGCVGNLQIPNNSQHLTINLDKNKCKGYF